MTDTLKLGDPVIEGKVSYISYLQIERLLTSQKPLTAAHDEVLFIIQHQTSELWMKLLIYELSHVKQWIRNDNMEIAFKSLARVSRTFEQLNNSWDVLRTLTPSDYTHFRGAFGTSSGFQSWQYRMIEFTLGNKNASMLAVHKENMETYNTLLAVYNEASLYDEAISLLARSGFNIDQEVLSRDVTKPYVKNDSVMAAWAEVYNNEKEHWLLYNLAEKLIDMEDYFRRWRFNHVTTVERVIGFKEGSGGTSGVEYLRRMLSVVLFPELWAVRSIL